MGFRENYEMTFINQRIGVFFRVTEEWWIEVYES